MQARNFFAILPQMFRDLDLQPQRVGIDRDPLMVPVTGAYLSARFFYSDAIGQALRKAPEIIPSIFTPEEIDYCKKYKVRPDDHFAARLAAKHIILDFLRDQKLGYQDVSIRNNEYDAPYFVFSKEAEHLLSISGIEAVHISISHENPLSLAFCCVENDKYPTSTMIVQAGADVCPAKPFENSLVRKTTFTEEETMTAKKQQYPASRFAMYYAAKESVVKVLGTLPGWIWKEIEVHEVSKDGLFDITLSGSANQRLKEMGAAKIVTSLSYREGMGALAFSLALT